jgi:hypothetical protein
MIPIPFLILITIIMLCYKYIQKTMYTINEKYYEFHFGENEHEIIQDFMNNKGL